MFRDLFGFGYEKRLQKKSLFLYTKLSAPAHGIKLNLPIGKKPIITKAQDQFNRIPLEIFLINFLLSYIFIHLQSSDDMMKMIIQKKSLAQEVADTLQHSIERGVFAINEKLPTEPELMQKFGVGRSTIREAIKYLSQLGFVHVQQGVGTFIISHSSNNVLDEKIERADFADIFEVRQLLELKIVEKAASNRTTTHLKKMKKKLVERKQYAESGDMLSCINADIDFHILIAQSCGNAILYQLYKTMSTHVSKFFSALYKDTSTFIESQDIHEDLLQAISDQNAEKAAKIAAKIIGRI